MIWLSAGGGNLVQTLTEVLGTWVKDSLLKTIFTNTTSSGCSLKQWSYTHMHTHEGWSWQ